MNYSPLRMAKPLLLRYLSCAALFQLVILRHTPGNQPCIFYPVHWTCERHREAEIEDSANQRVPLSSVNSFKSTLGGLCHKSFDPENEWGLNRNTCLYQYFNIRLDCQYVIIQPPYGDTFSLRRNLTMLNMRDYRRSAIKAVLWLPMWEIFYEDTTPLKCWGSEHVIMTLSRKKL